MAILQNTTVSGSLVVTGDLTARQFILSSSVTFFTESFASGSTRFGDSMDDTMTVTGSLLVTGSGTFASSVTTTQLIASTATNTSAIIAGVFSGTNNPRFFVQGEESTNTVKIIAGSSTGNDNMAFGVGGVTNNLFIKAGGNVGIGTTNPSEKLDVIGGGLAAGNGTIRTGITYGATGLVGTFTNHDLGIITNGTTKLTITSAGAATFASSVTATTATLSTTFNGGSVGQMHITSNGTEGGTITFEKTSGTAQKYKFGLGTTSLFVYNETAGNQPFTLTSAGFVGIGVTSPTGLLSLKAEVTNTPTIVFQNVSGGPNSAISNFTSATQTFTTIGANIYVNSTANISRFNASYAGSGITFDEGILRFMTGTTGMDPTTRMTIDASGNIGAPNGTNIYNASDIRLKQNITTITDSLSKVNALNPVKFNWIDGFVESEDGKDMLGFIAQEVQDIIPQAVEGFNSGNTINFNDLVIDNPLRVNEKFIIPVLVKAIQELSAKVTALENK